MNEPECFVCGQPSLPDAPRYCQQHLDALRERNHKAKFVAAKHGKCCRRRQRQFPYKLWSKALDCFAK